MGLVVRQVHGTGTNLNGAGLHFLAGGLLGQRILDLLAERIRIRLHRSQLLAGEVPHLAERGNAVIVAIAAHALQPNSDDAAVKGTLTPGKRRIVKSVVGGEAGRREGNLDGHELAAAEQVERPHILTRLPSAVAGTAKGVEPTAGTQTAGILTLGNVSRRPSISSERSSFS